MAVIERILVTVPLDEEHLGRLRVCLPEAEVIRCAPGDDAGIAAALRTVDAAVIRGRVDARFYEAPRLKWVHVDAAGMDSSATEELFRCGFAVTGSAGRSAPALAEHALFFMLHFAYHSRDILAAQEARRWGYDGQESTKALFGQTVGIVGLGHTGTTLAKYAKALGMRVVGYRRSAEELPDVDLLYSSERGDGIGPLLQESDFVVMAAPLNNGTYHMIGEEELQVMKPSAVLVNLGRGACVDEAALIRALESGEIAGAGLDTFEEEPLSPASPLWGMENVLVTPHFTPPCPDRVGRSLSIILENAVRLERGEPLLNQLTPADRFDSPVGR